jgi:DNA-binding transcriptional ArsR family regulator
MPAITAEPGTELKSKLFRGFSDGSRLSILEILLEGDTTVGEIVEQTGLSQPNVSSHLRCLSECGLALSRRDGRHIYYRASDPRVHKIIQLAEELLADSAKGVYECTRYE